jgi:uncharacterized protein YehS (DUF1456 family)
MELLENLVQHLTKEEVRFFKINSGYRADDKHPPKTKLLFDLLRNQRAPQPPYQIMQALYAQPSPNAYYRLRNRLSEDILKSLLEQYYRTNDSIAAMNELTLARIFLQREDYTLSLYLLQRAEKHAQRAEDEHALEWIYKLIIEHTRPGKFDIDPTAYLKKRRENFELLRKLRLLEDTITSVDYRLQQAQTFAQLDQSQLNALVDQALAEFDPAGEIMTSPKFRFRLIKTISLALLQQGAFQKLEHYLTACYDTLRAEGLLTAKNARFHGYLLTFLINTLIKNQRYEAALAYTESLGELLERYDADFKREYTFYYHNALVIIYNEFDPAQAIATLEAMKRDNTKLGASGNKMYVHSNLAIIQYSRGNYDKALKELVQLMIDDNFAQADPSYQLQFKLLDSIIRLSAGRYDEALRYLPRLRRDFQAMLAQTPRYAELLPLLEELTRALAHDRPIREPEAFRTFLATYPPTSSAAENEPMNYSAWLEQMLVSAGVRVPEAS